MLERVYSLSRQQIADVILLLLDDIEIEDMECIKEAVKIYQETKLDYVDCLYISKAERTGAELLSFDRKLMNLYKKRNNINS